MFKILCLALSAFWLNLAARGETVNSKIPLDGFPCSANVVGVCVGSKCGVDQIQQQITINQSIENVEMCALHSEYLKCVDLKIDHVSSTAYGRSYRLSQDPNSTITLIVSETGAFHFIRTDAVGSVLNTFTTVGLCSLTSQAESEFPVREAPR